jgi:hypothetical protein
VLLSSAMTPRESILGAWQLVSFTTTDADTGRVGHPLCTSPRGMILYTDDGHMSAQLADADMGGYLAYGGRFAVDEETSGRAERRDAVVVLHHDVTMSMMPELLASPQFRQANVVGDLLTLPATMTDHAGVTTHSTLEGRRMGKPETEDE